MTLTFENTNSHLVFTASQQNQMLSVDQWASAGDTFLRYQFLLLQELIDNGQAEGNAFKISVSHAEAARLNNSDLDLLGLPGFFQGVLKLEANGELGRDGFAIDLRYLEYDLSDYLLLERVGSVLLQNQKPYAILSSSQFTLCETVARMPIQKGQQQWAMFSEIKRLAKKAGALLDAYLTREEVLIPETVEVEMKLDQDQLLIQPDISTATLENTTIASEFVSRFERFPLLRPTYTVKNAEGDSVRVAFSEAQQAELTKVKQLKCLSGEKKEHFLAHPEQFLNPDIINLDRFSQRVLEIGLYQPKFYPFVSPYKSEWIPGFLIESSAEERKQIKFKTPEELAPFEVALQQSQQNQSQHMIWDGHKIPLEVAQEIIATAHQQFKNPKSPLKQTSAGKKCLIIKDNIEEIAHGGDHVAEEVIDNIAHHYTPPPSLRAKFEVLEHQKEGIAWLQALCSEGHSGALLADDMGVGKTLQGLSFIDWHHATNPGKPYLIVAPVSLLENWQAEYYKFFDAPLTVSLAYGAFLKDLFAGRSWEQQVDALQEQGIVLTTYETLRSSQLVFCAVDWAVVLLDEAQKVKNPGTLATNAVKALKADFRIAATGTPVENTLIDLWCIMDFTTPGLLGSYKGFAEQYQRPLLKADTDVAALGEQLRQHIGIYIKRRLKTDIAKDLPQKHIQRLEHTMSSEQQAKYMEVLNQRTDSEGSQTRQHMLQVIQSLREVCAHPFLLDSDFDTYTLNDLLKASSKLTLCYQLIERIAAAQEKVILFAERRETQRMLARLLQEGFGLTPSVINGTTPSSAQRENAAKMSRQQAIDKFQAVSGFNGIVMSPIAAGVGLNVTGANHVIHYARHWNPAKEDQATDRAYRIGQRKDVYVYLPLAVHPEFKSFDLILDELLERKRQLASASLFPTEQAEVGLKDLYNQLVK